MSKKKLKTERHFGNKAQLTEEIKIRISEGLMDGLGYEKIDKKH